MAGQIWNASRANVRAMPAPPAHGGMPNLSRRLGLADSAQPPIPGTYAALDLGTNNCRLLIARPHNGHCDLHSGDSAFRIVDSFSRIVRLGDGLSRCGALNEAAMERTLVALEICRDKMQAQSVSRARLIATEACRGAANGAQFIRQVRRVTGLDLEIVDRRTEAHLAAEGCAVLADPEAAAAVLFDIGGGSSEVVWLAQDAAAACAKNPAPRRKVSLWASLRLGVVSLAEKFGGVDVTRAVFEAMVEHVMRELRPFARRAQAEKRCAKFHLLGTSGTVTTLAGIHLDLARYDRRRVDGLWMSNAEVEGAMQRLLGMSWQQRVANGCIGHERADLVLAGCAIFEAIRRAFPSRRVRIADRGLREGLLMQMMNADGAWGRA